MELLRSKKYEVLSISETQPQMPDAEVAKLAKKYSGILITEDKDFGEMIFAHGLQNLTVIFLRYDQPVYEQIEQALLETIARYYQKHERFFITITKKKIRVRTL